MDQILCDCCYEIRRIPIGHSSTVCIGQPEIVSNIMGVVLSDWDWADTDP
jgi:hypothetical protein